MIDDDGLIAAFHLDGNGGGAEIDWHSINARSHDQGLTWVHLDRNSDSTHAWIHEKSGVDKIIANALLAEETRPRSFSTQKGLFVILRGVNLNPGHNPEDMVSLRIWLEEHQIISVRARRTMAISDIGARIKEGRGPLDPAGFLVMVTDRLIEHMGPAIEEIAETLDTMEIALDGTNPLEARNKLMELRHQAVILRRYLSPQREALGRIQMEQLPWLDQSHKMEIREITDRTTRYIEDLDEIRERSVIIQDELINELTVSMNKKIYVLTVIAGIIMPLSFATGLLGINVGGMPLAESKDGFWLISGGLAILGIIEFFLFRWLKWI